MHNLLHEALEWSNQKFVGPGLPVSLPYALGILYFLSSLKVTKSVVYSESAFMLTWNFPSRALEGSHHQKKFKGKLGNPKNTC